MARLTFLRRPTLPALVLALAACSDEPPPAGEPAPALTAAILAEAKYTLMFDEGAEVQLREGRFVREGFEGLIVTMYPRVARGDLDENGVADAAVVLMIDGGGSGTFYELAAVLDRDGKPRHAASVALGDRIDLEAVDIVDGDIVVRYRTHGPQDPLCCPTLQTVRAFALGEDGLVDVTQPDEGGAPAL